LGTTNRILAALTLGALIGLVATLCIPSGAQTGETPTWQDKTFALAQHPISGAPIANWLPFSFGHGNDTSLVIWDSGGSGHRALVSVHCEAGRVLVNWDGGEIELDATGAAAGSANIAGFGHGNTTTVYSSYVELRDYRVFATGSAGRYAVTVDISD
jgi:hypothetical protein